MTDHADTIRRYINAEVLDVPPSEFQATAEAALDALLAERDEAQQLLKEKTQELAVAYGSDRAGDEREWFSALDRCKAERQQAIDALLGVADGLLSDPCWCGEEWWEAHDAHADEREHSEWCLAARAVVKIGVTP